MCACVHVNIGQLKIMINNDYILWPIMQNRYSIVYKYIVREKQIFVIRL